MTLFTILEETLAGAVVDKLTEKGFLNGAVHCCDAVGLSIGVVFARIKRPTSVGNGELVRCTEIPIKKLSRCIDCLVSIDQLLAI